MGAGGKMEASESDWYYKYGELFLQNDRRRLKNNR
jgi:hypothetical protein